MVHTPNPGSTATRGAARRVTLHFVLSVWTSRSWRWTQVEIPGEVNFNQGGEPRGRTLQLAQRVMITVVLLFRCGVLEPIRVSKFSAFFAF